MPLVTPQLGRPLWDSLARNAIVPEALLPSPAPPQAEIFSGLARELPSVPFGKLPLLLPVGGSKDVDSEDDRGQKHGCGATSALVGASASAFVVGSCRTVHDASPFVGTSDRKTSAVTGVRQRQRIGPMPPMPRWLRRKISKVSGQLQRKGSGGTDVLGINGAGGGGVSGRSPSRASSSSSLVSLASTVGSRPSSAATEDTAASVADARGIPQHVAKAVGPRHLVFFDDHFGRNDPSKQTITPKVADQRAKFLAFVEHRNQLRKATHRAAIVRERIAMRHKRNTEKDDGNQTSPGGTNSQSSATPPSPTKRLTPVREDGEADSPKVIESQPCTPRQQRAAPRVSSLPGSLHLPKALRMRKINRLRRHARLKNVDTNALNDESAQQARRVESLFKVFSWYAVQPGDALDHAEDMLLHWCDLRSALHDVGLLPSRLAEKQDVRELIEEAQNVDADSGSMVEADRGEVEDEDDGNKQQAHGTGFDHFVDLVSRVRQALHYARRSELSDSFYRAIDEDEVYDLTALRPCFEAIGCVGPLSDCEWESVQAAFTNFEDKAVEFLSVTLEDLGETGRFELFEGLFHYFQERIVASRRELERSLADDVSLPRELFDVCRPELLRSYDVFNEVLNQENEHEDGASQVSSLNFSGIVRFIDLLGCNMSTEPKLRSMALQNETYHFVDSLVMLIRVQRLDLESARLRLRSTFNIHDPHQSGRIRLRDVSRIVLSEIGCMPRTRREQREIGLVIDELDEEGTGYFSFSEFECLVQRIRQRSERLKRQDEMEFGKQLGMRAKTCVELRAVFRHHAAKCCGPGLDAQELRTILERSLPQKFSIEEVDQLLTEYAQEEDGLQVKSFLRLISAKGAAHFVTQGG
eukprot:TRINITY_DN22653_c0_g1_i2.p1 TRINITY_DN22653_c0_g1~~TRINITY_DN22653_c0_g1_i2.p1  ORF type:complete len:868 (-),score=136.65 TRINITY_DN22653_c0_g1_i2:44-2647(-)